MRPRKEQPLHQCPYCLKYFNGRTKFCCKSHSMSYWNLKRSAEGTNVFLDSVKGKEIRSNEFRNAKIAKARKLEAANFTHGWLQIETRAKSNKSSMLSYYSKLGKTKLCLYFSGVESSDYFHIGITSQENPKSRENDDRSIYKIFNIKPILIGSTSEIIELEYQLRVKFVTLNMVRLTHYYEWYNNSDYEAITNFIKEFSNSSETIQFLE